jgi:hypothetical protein
VNRVAAGRPGRRVTRFSLLRLELKFSLRAWA